MKRFAWILPVMILGTGMLWMPPESTANPNYTKKTGQKCGYCHVGEWSSGKYTEAGDHFKEHNTLKNFVPKQQNQQASSTAKNGEKTAAKN